MLQSNEENVESDKLWPRCSERSVIKKCKLCNIRSLCEEKSGEIELLIGGDRPHKLIKEQVKALELYDNGCQILLFPCDWNNYVRNDVPFAVKINKVELLRVALLDSSRLMVSLPPWCFCTTDFCSKTCLKTYIDEYLHYKKIATVRIPNMSSEKIKECLNVHDNNNGLVIEDAHSSVSHSIIDNEIDFKTKETFLCLDHMFKTVFDSIEYLFTGSGIGYLPGFSFFVENKRFISLKALDKLLDLIRDLDTKQETRFPTFLAPEDFTEQKKIKVLKWILNQFGYNIDRSSKRKTVLAAVEKHEATIETYLD